MKFYKFAVCCALFIAACVPAYSQNVRVNIPFDFMVSNHTLPAGEYVVSAVWGESNAAWRIADRQRHSAYLITNSASSPAGVEHHISLVFRQYGGEYSLIQFWLDGNRGRDVIRPKIAPNVIAQSNFVQIAAER